MKVRTLQQIFDAVIDSGLYSEEGQSFMCLSLDDAYDRGVISEKEYNKGIKSIKVFIRRLPHYSAMHSTPPLACYLNALKGDFVEVAPFSECLAVYQNWAKRPRIRSKV